MQIQTKQTTVAKLETTESDAYVCAQYKSTNYYAVLNEKFKVYKLASIIRYVSYSLRGKLSN